MVVPLLPMEQEDQMAAEKINFRSDKVKHIKKDEKMSERDRLKEKMKRMKPDFRNMLRTQIKTMNKPSSSVFVKK